MIKSQGYIITTKYENYDVFWTGRINIEKGFPIWSKNVEAAQVFQEKKYAENVVCEWDMLGKYEIRELN